MNAQERERKISIGLCGYTKAGKDYVAGMFSRYGFQTFNLTELVLRPVATVREERQDRDGLRRLLTKLDNNANEMLFAHVYAAKAKRVVLPNVRLLSTIEFWRVNSGYEFYLGLVEASVRARYRRYQLMKRDIDQKVTSVEQFQKVVDQKDLDVNELDRILEEEIFDFTIDNNKSDRRYLAKQIRRVLRDVVKLPELTPKIS